MRPYLLLIIRACAQEGGPVKANKKDCEISILDL